MSRQAIKAVKVDLDKFNMAEDVQQQNGVGQPAAENESPTPEEKKTKKKKPVSPKTEKRERKDLKPLSKDLSQKISDNFLRYDRSADKGMSMSIPTEINEALKEISNEKYKRLSARTIASAILASVIENYDVNAVIDQFFERVHYTVPTEEQLENRRKNTERVKEYRSKNK